MPGGKSEPSAEMEDDAAVVFEPLSISKAAKPLGAGIAQAQDVLSEAKRSSRDTLKSDVSTEGNQTISVIDAITAPFEPETNGCSLPAKIVSKLKKTKKWAPEDLRILANSLKVQNVILSDRASINVLLSTVSLQEGTRPPVKVVAMGGEVYQTFNPAPFIDRVRNNFAYTLDCSGYLNAAVSFAGGVSSGSMKTAASSALDAKRSAFVAYASVFPPLAIALTPDKVPANMLDAMPPRARLDVLYALNAALPPEASDSAKIFSPLIVEALWTSSSGDSSFQGQASFAANGRASFGIASVGGGVDAGVSLARTSTYTNFKTYLMNTEVVAADPITVATMRAKLQNAMSGAVMLQEPKRVNSRFEFALDLPRQLCESTSWLAQGLANPHPIVGSAGKAFASSSGCKFTVAPQTPQTVDTLMTAGGFLLTGKNGKLTFSYPVTVSTAL